MSSEPIMEQHFVYNQDAECMVAQTAGFGSLSNIFNALDLLLSHPKWEPGNNAVINFSTLELSHLQPGDIQELATKVSFFSPELGNGRFAVVVSSDLLFGLGRMWELTIGTKTDLKIKIFRDPQEALIWTCRKN